MQFTDDEWLAFASKLEHATNAGKLVWEGSDASENPFDESPGFSARIPGNAIYNLRSRDDDGAFPFVLRVSDPTGAFLSEFVTVPVGDPWSQDHAQMASAIISRLYSSVVRLITGAPERARSLLEGLDELIGDVSDDDF